MAGTKEGISIRVRSWPVDTWESPKVRQVRGDLKGWQVGRVLCVVDRGFSSRANRAYRSHDGEHYIIGEKLRGESEEARLVLSRPGRYWKVRENLG